MRQPLYMKTSELLQLYGENQEDGTRKIPSSVIQQLLVDGTGITHQLVKEGFLSPRFTGILNDFSSD